MWNGAIRAGAGVRATLAMAFALLLGLTPAPALAQGFAPADVFAGLPIEQVVIVIANPSTDKALNDRVTDSVRRRLALFPGSSFSADRTDFVLAQAQRTPDLAGASYQVGPGQRDGLILTITLTLTDRAASGAARGVLANGRGFPVLYNKDGVYLRARLEALALSYSNQNAWFGQPAEMLTGNPLVAGIPAGKGLTSWVENYVVAGLAGIRPVTDKLYVYGAGSLLATSSSGQELFSDRTRSYVGVEDAYAGFIVGDTTPRGDRYGFNLSVGRQRFTLANAFLIANTAANGGDRAALQANARWAADMVALAQLFWNGNKLEAFYVNPDELPILDTRTEIVGVNLELAPAPGLMVAGTWLTVPQSTYAYYGPQGLVGTRKGLELWDLRFTWTPAPPGRPGPFFGGEIAQQTNRNFPMRAVAGYGEIGWSFPTAAWSPTLSYRLAYFSGDDPANTRYGRWDPLLSGGNGEQWVQGANMFKVVQDSNSVAQRIQARFKPLRSVELVPQIWIFRSDSLSNFGGNPALQQLSSKDYGTEVNVTVKWFVSRNVYVHAHVAYTLAGEAIRNALNNQASNWASGMIFIRYAF